MFLSPGLTWLTSPIITETSEHSFPDKATALTTIRAHGRLIGHPVLDQSGRGGQQGSFVCGFAPTRYSSEKKASLAEGELRLNVDETGTVTSIRTGPVRDCHWHLNYNTRKDGTVVLTTQANSRCLEHSPNHPMHPTLPDRPRIVNQAEELLAEERSGLSTLLTMGIKDGNAARAFLEKFFNVKYAEILWAGMLKASRIETKVTDGQDFAALIDLMQERHRNKGDHFGLALNKENGSVDRLIFMSADMITNCRRIGEVFVMDTTMGTNRFGYPMCIISGIDEFGCTAIFAVAFTSTQKTGAFEWILDEMRVLVGTEAWERVASIMTDGDQAMAAAIASRLPHAVHLRCVFHLKQNIRSNLHKKTSMSADNIEAYIKDWLIVVCRSRDESEYGRGKHQLALKYPDTNCDYMNDDIWAIEKKFAACFTFNVTTLGIKSTQRVESLNAKCKGALAIGIDTEVAEAAARILQSNDKQELKKIEAWKQQAQQGLTHQSMSSWKFELREVTPYAESWIVKEEEFSGAYIALGFRVNGMTEWQVRVDPAKRDRHTALLNEASGTRRAWLEQRVKERQLIEIDSVNEAEEQKKMGDKALDARDIEFFFLQSLIEEPVRIVRDPENSEVSCSCGSVKQRLLPCRHVMAVNRAINSNKKFVPTQILSRWTRSQAVMEAAELEPVAHEPFTDSEQLDDQPNIVLGDLRDEHKERSLQLDRVLGRAKEIAMKGPLVAQRCVLMVTNWFNSEIAANPVWAADPPLYAKGNSRRIGGDGEHISSSANARTHARRDGSMEETEVGAGSCCSHD